MKIEERCNKKVNYLISKYKQVLANNENEQLLKLTKDRKSSRSTRQTKDQDKTLKPQERNIQKGNNSKVNKKSISKSSKAVKSNLASSRESPKEDIAARLVGIRKESDILKNANEELTALNLKLKADINTLQEQIKNLQSESDKNKTTHKEVIETLNDQILKSKEEIESMKKNVKCLEAKILMPTNDQSNIIINKMKEYVKSLMVKFTSMEKDKNNLKRLYTETLEELNKVRGEYKTELVTVSQSIDRLETKLLDCKSKVLEPSNKTQAIGELQTKLSEIECERENLKKIYDEKVEELSKANDKLMEENKNIKSIPSESELVVKLSQVENEREEYKAKYIAKLEELGKVKSKAEKLKEGFEKLIKKKNEEGIKTIKKMEEEIQEIKKDREGIYRRLLESNAEIERAKSEKTQNLKYVNEDANSEEETLESLHQPTDKKVKVIPKENEDLVSKVEVLEAEQEKYKQLLAEYNKKLTNESEAHKQQLLKFKTDYCKVFQDMNSLKKALKSAQEELVKKDEEIDQLRGKNQVKDSINESISVLDNK